MALTLLDTPGHVDFAAQTEQVLSVLDYAVLVISANSGIQGYTLTLWRLLERYHVPVFIFVNKMDSTQKKRQDLVQQLQANLSAACLDFGNAIPKLAENNQLADDFYESVALSDDEILNQFLDTGHVKPAAIRDLISQRKIFPCYFGSALKVDKTDELLTGLEYWTQEKPMVSGDFGARVFKVSHTEKKNG